MRRISYPIASRRSACTITTREKLLKEVIFVSVFRNVTIYHQFDPVIAFSMSSPISCKKNLQAIGPKLQVIMWYSFSRQLAAGESSKRGLAHAKDVNWNDFNTCVSGAFDAWYSCRQPLHKRLSHIAVKRNAPSFANSLARPQSKTQKIYKFWGTFIELFPKERSYLHKHSSFLLIFF